MTRNSFALAATFLATLTIGVVPGVAGSKSGPEDTLKDIRSLAVSAANDADRLDMKIQDPQSTADSQMSYLDSLKEEVNRMGRDITKLEAERDGLSQREQQAVDRILPLIQEAALDTTKTIAYVNDNRTHLVGPGERVFTHSLEKENSRIAATVKLYLDSEALQGE